MTLDPKCVKTITEAELAQCKATIDDMRQAAAQGKHLLFLSPISTLSSLDEIDFSDTSEERVLRLFDLVLRTTGIQNGPGYGDGNGPTDLYFAYRGVHWILEFTCQGSALDALKTAMDRKYCQEVRANESKYVVAGLAFKGTEKKSWTLDYAVHSSL